MTFDKKYHDGEYKTVGQAAVALNQEEHQEVGETMEAMQKKYAEEMQATIEKGRHLDHFFIVVLRKKEPLSIEMPVSNVLRQWFIGPRLTQPSAEVLKKDFPLHDHDVWEITDGEPKHLWTLPGPDAWDLILANKEENDPQLVGWMIDYEKGVLK